MSISQVIADYTTYAIESGGWMEMDRLYVQNRLAALIGVDELEEVTHQPKAPAIETLVAQMIQTARDNQVIQTDEDEERLTGQIYDLVTPPSSVLNALFAQRYNQDKEEATDYFHFLSMQNHTIREEVNIHLVETSQGVLCQSETQGTEEKNIPTERHTYPHCGLCFTNEGFRGTGNTPTLPTFRYVRMNLKGESFGFRYVPYPLWHEHSLFVSEAERYQMMNPQTVDHLLQIATIFPQYFVAAEMDQLPENERPQHIVYQGGSDQLPLFERTPKATFKLDCYDEIAAEVLDYPMTVCRFSSTNTQQLQSFISHVIQAWRIYQADGITAFSKEGALNHAMDLVARMKNDTYEIYTIFRTVTGPRLRLAQVLGVAPCRHQDKQAAEKLSHLLLEADPFSGNQQWIDHWMAKMNTLGD